MTRKVARSTIRCNRREHLWWWTEGDRVRIVNRRAIDKLDSIAHADVDIARHEKHHHGLTIRCPNRDMMVVGDRIGMVLKISSIVDERQSNLLCLPVVVCLGEGIRRPHRADMDMADHLVMDKAAVGEVARRRKREAIAGSSGEATTDTNQARAEEGFPIVGTTALRQVLDG